MDKTEQKNVWIFYINCDVFTKLFEWGKNPNFMKKRLYNFFGPILRFYTKKSSEFMIPTFHDFSFEQKIMKCGDFLYIKKGSHGLKYIRFCKLGEKTLCTLFDPE